MAGTKNSGGRNKKSRQAHVIQHTFRGDRHAEDATPEAPIGVPTPPKELEGDALEEWLRIIGWLTELGTLSTVDAAILYQYCRLFAETEAIAQEKAETEGTVRILQENLDRVDDLTFDQILEAAQELTKQRKLAAGYITKVRQGRMALRMLLVELGLTPAARARVKLPAGKPKTDPLKDRYFGGSKPSA